MPQQTRAGLLYDEPETRPDDQVSNDSREPSPRPSTATSHYGTLREGADSGFATRASKSQSATTLELDPSESYVSLANACESISLYHEANSNSEQPLKNHQYHFIDGNGNSFGRVEPQIIKKHARNGYSEPPGDTCCAASQADATQPVGKFRYVVALLIVLGVLLNAYASNTMYIAAIEMISNDVVQSELTLLRAKHLSNDPLALNKNAALPGTCPVEAVHRDDQANELIAFLQEKLKLNLPNATEISAREKLAMQKDTEALMADVDQRIATGQLVDWDIQQRGYVFTAHTVGTILMAVPVSRLGLMYGSKAVTFVCMFLSAFRMAMLPTIAGHAPFWATFTLELVIGGAGGNIILLGYPIAAAWLLPDEANFFVAINILSSMVGVAATNFVSSQLLVTGLFWSWCYYIPGIMLFFLSLSWLFLGSDRPEVSRFVSKAELELLQNDTLAKRNESLLTNNTSTSGSRLHLDDETQPLTGRSRDNLKCYCPFKERAKCPVNSPKRKPNWTVIFTCPSVWAMILISFANHWTTKNATFWPTFFSNILHIDSGTIGIMLGVKGAWALIFCTIFAIATRKLVVKRPFNMSLTAYRRWNAALATIIYSTSVILMIFMDCSIIASSVALLIQPIMSSFNSLGPDQLPLDLSAEDSGLLVSVVRLFAVGDIVALPVSSFILSHAPDALAGDRPTWRVVWMVGLAVRLIAGLFFVLFAKSQPKSYSRVEPSGPCKSSDEKTVPNITITTNETYARM